MVKFTSEIPVDSHPVQCLCKVASAFPGALPRPSESLREETSALEAEAWASASGQRHWSTES